MLSIQIIKGELCEKYRVATLRIHIPAERSCSLFYPFQYYNVNHLHPPSLM